jgi:hypothetical protein
MNFFNHHIGEFAALLTAFFWTVTSLSFESASHKIGSIVSVAGVALFFL